MKRYLVPAWLLAGGLLLLARPVSGQFYPGYGGGWWGGTNGSAALLGSAYKDAAVIEAKAQSRLAGQQAAMNQNYVVQSGIRNTLSSQATARSDAILSQRQANQDWWFQHQQQQMAQRQGGAMMGGSTTLVSDFAPAGAPPRAATDIIKWPSLLQEVCFASDRAIIEAPYRRTPPQPTEADYRQMVNAVEDMKAVLQWRVSEGVDTNEYNTAKTFLNQLGGELTARLQAPNR